MIIFMVSQNFYPHDRVLESQAWKKVVYIGGKARHNTIEVQYEKQILRFAKDWILVVWGIGAFKD